ncbi:MAG: putative Ig domain-containing protein [Planctomycetota bacterium]|nr:putative Ig domain-containing protein [Planctomycetota bacterium]
MKGRACLRWRPVGLCLSVFIYTLFVYAVPLGAEDDWRRPFAPDGATVVLYHFDEGVGDQTHDALGDKALTLRANKRGLWGRRAGFGTTARFQRRDDDPNLLIGPTNNDKLHLRGCTQAWTIEAWVKYAGDGGLERGRTSLNLCGTDDEGFSLPTGLRGGWSFGLYSKTGIGKLKNGITPWARFMGSPRGKDPNHDTSGILLPYYSGGFTGAEPAVITDNAWHHVAWQFRYRDQTHFFFLDGQLVRRVQLPITDANRIIVNDAVNVGVPFVVGGWPHSQDPPFNLKWGSHEGQIDELRISSVLRYPVADALAIIRQKLPAAGVNIPYSVELGTDRARGAVVWRIVDGRLPPGLTLDPSHGRIHGTATKGDQSAAFTIAVRDESGANDNHRFKLSVAAGELLTESLPPAFVGKPYAAEIETRLLASPLKWEISQGKLPQGISLERVADSLRSASARLRGTSSTTGWSRLTIQVTDANGQTRQRDVVLNVLPANLIEIEPDEHTVALFDWQGADGKLIPDRMGDVSHTLTWTNMGGDRRVIWPGRDEKFPQFTGHGEHGFATAGKGPPKLDFKTCDKEWTLEVWVRRGGPLQAFGGTVRGKHSPFHFGHVCGTYDKTKKGIWELYLSDIESMDGSMAPGINFYGAAADKALEHLDPWHRPGGIVGNRAGAGIRDTQWHHLAWQYHYDTDLHELYLDGRLIWKMQSPDGCQLVNDRIHEAQFSVSTRLTGYSRYGGGFNYLGEGNFFGQIGEIRISNVRRYGR